jgi:acyl-CoA synthetase (AMP-forming)/AMP-acid ligase II
MHRLLTAGDGVSGESAQPILSALGSYRGTIVDLDFNVVVSGAELSAATDDVARLITDRGLAPGDRVILSVANGPAFIAALCGIFASGATPLVLHGDTPSQELQRYARQYAARCVITDRRAIESSQHLTSFPDWLSLYAVELPLDPQSLSYPVVTGASFHPTSGTTGDVKIAVRTVHQSAEEARHYIETMRITQDDRILCVVPMSHAYGFGMGFVVSLLSGASLVTTRRFNPRTIPRALAEHRITIFPAVPAMLELLLRAGLSGMRLPRMVLAAGAPLAQSTATAFHEQTGMPITPLYGSTETGGITVAIDEGVPLPTGCVGRPMNGVAARIEPIPDSTELPLGVGRVQIRSSSMMSGYLTTERIDDSAIDDGWFDTGDLGRIDAGGCIQLVGREKEIINVFGLKVVPSEVEEAISSLAGVREVKVYSGTHRTGSELVKAAVAANSEVDVARVRAHCEAHLPPHKRPQVIHLLDSLPRMPTGKIIRDQLP